MPLRRAFRLHVLLFALLGIAVAIPNISSASTIGLYTDESGSTCSFAGNDVGVVTAYVVVKADVNGVLGMRFAAPVPACMGATFLYETPVDGVTSIGSTQTGISLVFPTCAIVGYPAVVLEVGFFRSGSTDPCCEFPIIPDPAVGVVEVTDCSFQTRTPIAGVSHFNASEACPCIEAAAPHAPIYTYPPDQATGINVKAPLVWQPSPLDSNIASYRVYLGPHAVPGLAATVTQAQFQPAVQLSPSTQYYWRVVALNNEGLEASGPIWSFTTGTITPPFAPVLSYPQNQATLTPVDITLVWSAFDPDGDPLTYSVFFGTTNNPGLLVTGLATSQYELPTLLHSTTYWWRVVARDPYGLSTTSSTWSFTTKEANQPPFPPAFIYPAHLSNNVNTTVTLSWTSMDLENDPLTYDVYFGPGVTPPLVATGLAETQYSVPTLVPNTSYRWKIVAHDSYGNFTTGNIWRFTTGNSNFAPNLPTNPSPVPNTTDVPTSTTLSWQATDPNGDPMTYRVYFGTTLPPLLYASELTSPSLPLNSLLPGAVYYWRVFVRDDKFAETQGPVWKFTTTGPVTGAEDSRVQLALGRNHPNPFNPQTTIPYSVPTGRTQRVRLVIYDTSGRAVRTLVDEDQTGGSREVVWQGDDDGGRSVASGVYYCVLQVGGERRTQKLVLLK